MINRMSLAILIGGMLVTGSTACALSATRNGFRTDAQANAPANEEGDNQGAEKQGTPTAPITDSASGSPLASGVVLNAELNTTLDSKKAKAGDPVLAHLTDAVKADNKAVIPKGAKLVGHVTQAVARGKGDSESALAIKFDKAVLKGGQEIPLSVWVRAIAAEPRAISQPSPDANPIAGTGSAAAAGSPMKPAPPPVVGINNDTLAAENGIGGSNDPSGRTSAAVGGLNAGGQLTANSRGVFGLEGLRLSTDFSNTEQGSLITSSGKNVHLDGGTRLLLVSFGGVASAPSK